MDQTLLQQLAKRLNLTDGDMPPEPYVLTAQDEVELVENAIKREKENFRWRMIQKGFKEGDIDLRISQEDWEAKIDKETIFSIANSNKNNEIWHIEQREKDKKDATARLEALKRRCNSRYMFWVMEQSSLKNYSKELIINESNKKLIHTLCYWAAEDVKLETEFGYSLKKGLLIRGVSGIGKTHCVKCLEYNELNPILIQSMIEITDSVRLHGEYEIRMGDKKAIYLDDVGTEEPVIKHYGSSISFFKDFIERVYLQNKDFSKIIISTNCSFSEIEEKYGFRVASRMREMFNVIDVKGTDMRRK